MSFIVFLVRFVEKGPKTTKYGKIRGVLSSGEGPRSGEGFPCHNVAKKENLDMLGFAAT